MCMIELFVKCTVCGRSDVQLQLPAAVYTFFIQKNKLYRIYWQIFEPEVSLGDACPCVDVDIFANTTWYSAKPPATSQFYFRAL
jgi:hypothetical protein